MSRIVTDLERPLCHSTAWSGRRLRLISRVTLPACVVVVASMPILLPSAGNAGASTLSSDQAKATQLEQEIQSTGQQIDGLDQQYEAALAQKAAVDQQINATQAQITKTQGRIAADRHTLQKAAVQAYVSGGTASAQETPFTGAGTASLDANLYDQVITGDLTTTVAQYDTAVAQLDAQRQTLRSEDTQAAQAVTAAQTAEQRAQTLENQQQAALTQVKGQIATDVAQQQAAAQAAATAAAQAKIAAAQQLVVAHPSASVPAPPPASGNAGTVAVAAAESQLGVPYVWGGETPGVGFDCSGLVAWAWGQAGVSLPHYSGAQMADSTPVPISDLEPGDLLFYGPGGATHVAMYVGGGEMIEAPFTGTVVRIDPVRLGTGFAGAGRP
jgi:peptidoglycan DL-endopeptidase CwlO